MVIAADPVRRLIEHRTGHPVISLYLDLDPEQFATAPARAAQIRSLIDQAARELDALGGLSHDELVTLRADLQRVDGYLSSSGEGGVSLRGPARSACSARARTTCSR